MTPEEFKHEQARPSCAAVGFGAASEAGDDRREADASTGGADGPAGLGRSGSAGGADPGEQAEERGWPPAASAGAARRDAADGNAEDELSGCGGSNPVLRAGAVSVRADRDGLDARFHDDRGLHRIDGGRRNRADQRVRGGAGGGGEVSRKEGDVGGHDSAGSSDPVAERDGIDGVVFQLGGGGEQARWPGAEGLRGESVEQAEGGQGEGAQVSSLREDEADAAGAARGNGESGRVDAGAARAGAVGGRGSAARILEGGARESAAAARDDEEALAANPLLAAHRLGRERQDHQSAYPRAVRDRAGQDRQDGGVWTAVGNHSAARWISAGDAGEASQRAGGCAICRARGARPYPALWRGAACLCVRSRWAQPTECRGAESARGESGGTGPPRPDEMVGEQPGPGADGQGESGDRGRDRSGEERAIWLPPPARPLDGDDGGVRSAGSARLQPQQADPPDRRPRRTGPGWLNRGAPTAAGAT